MGLPAAFSPAKLVCAVLLHDTLLLEKLTPRLRRDFGEIDFQSEPLAFDFTEYYRNEMGSGLLRVFFSFATLMDPARLSEAKLATNQIEQEFSAAGARLVNVDPGLLFESRFVLATTKDYSHRIPLQDGIYAEVTLLYTQKQFRPLPWTYPDYRSSDYRRILTIIRGLYRGERKH